MAYKIERAKKKIIDTLELVTANGQIKAVMDVSISLPQIAGKYRGAVLAVEKARQTAAQLQSTDDPNPEQAYEMLGQAITAVYELLFGAKNTEELVVFFDGNYEELLQQTTPFLLNVVEPAVQEYIADCRREVVLHHKKGKMQR